MFSRNQGRRGGTYDYFACIGRHTHRTGCQLPYVPVEAVEEAIVRYYSTITLGPDLVADLYKKMLTVAKRRNASAQRRARRERKRILDLERERRKLLQAHLAGAVPIDLLKEEQGRITAELANAGAALANTEIHWEALEANLKAALGLTAKFEKAYQVAKPVTRRLFNQAVLEWVKVDVYGQLAQVKLAEPFKTLLDEGLMTRLTEELKTPASQKSGGSTTVELVEVSGLEPPTSTLRT